VQHHDAAGAGAPLVVLIHGSTDRSSAFAGTLRLLGELDVITYDRRGYGRSLDVPLATSLHDHVVDLVEILDGRAASLVGCSFGGHVAIATAIRYPALVHSMGLWEVPIHWVDSPLAKIAADEVHRSAATTNPEAVAERWVRRAVGDTGWQALRPDQRDRFRAEGRAYQADMRCVIEPPYDIDRLSVPGVCAAGSLSTNEHRGLAALLARRLKMEYVEVPGARHFGPRDQPAGFADLVRRVVATG
jgi:pimeloyl-ACP methyl ester carboxylesterase